MKKRILSVLVATAMMCSMLSGCFSLVVDSKLEANGSGTVSAATGFTEDYFALMYAAEENTTLTFEEYMAAAIQADGLVPYEYNGVTYYGMYIEDEPVTDETMFNEIMFGADGLLIPNSQESGVTIEPDGTMTLTVYVDYDDIAADVEETEELLNDVTYEELFAETYVDFTLEMPKTIGRASGNMNCYTLDDDTVTLDFLAISMELMRNPEKPMTFQFSTAEPTFVDTPITMWYTAAAEAMAEGGLMAGTGNRHFSPDWALTVGELAQILARATGLEVGTGETGYWAEIAVESCLEKGYITDRGEVNQANYGVTVDRQEAIAAMQRASGLKPTGTLTASDIPDFDSIKDEFKQDILDAYNSGVTAGTDANLTCGPNLNLTRAQVAQLFYALGWTAPLQ